MNRFVSYSWRGGFRLYWSSIQTYTWKNVFVTFLACFNILDVWLSHTTLLVLRTNTAFCDVFYSAHKKWLYFAIWACRKFVHSFFSSPFFFFFPFNSSNSHELVQGSALCKQFFTLRMLLLKSRYCAKYHRSLLRFYTVCHHCSSYSIESHLGLWYSSQVFSGEKSACFFWFCFLFLIKNRKKKSLLFIIQC